MRDVPPQTALIAFLQAKDAAYYGKVCELRESVRGWLNYIPHTFPHYTRHTLEHSDEIVLQMSKLLFQDDHPESHVIDLSPAEAYILIAAAYLHDAGMVTSDSQKQEILASDAWKNWTTDGPGANRWQAVQALRESAEPADEAVRHFLADVQTRFLIAEFVRRTHHVRAGEVTAQHEAALGRFALDDPVLLRTISDVCVAHGLRPHELEDRERYPDRRDVRGQPVNVRFVAILLRLGDLLDMSYDRACPLLLNAASPLPADSLAHWTQYQRITHRLTAPDRIEITAECQTQDEHRLLQDWCQWLTDEVREAATLMARVDRHSNWQPPVASLDGQDPPIIIRPAQAATYIPLNWTFELDHDQVFERLIYDVYDSPNVFIRELIQNALDANRCQMYAGLASDRVEPPEYPTQIDEDRRRRYPVYVSLRTQDVQNQLSGEIETRQILSVEDCGIGMDNEIIQRYFLQVGRSYYTTDEFRRSFRFVPTSRFGLGFLSVFAVSDHVTVETYKPSSPRRDGPIRLTLSGPRNYLLTDQGQRQSSGTRIEVLLREPLEPGALTELVSGWCRRVEFPLIVDDLGTQTIVEAEGPEDFTYEIPDITEEGAIFAVKAFPIRRPAIEGELYVFARIDSRGESWAAWDWAQYRYPRQHPQAAPPTMPGYLTCLHGLAVTGEAHPSTVAHSARLDYRGDTHRATVSRGRRLHRLPVPPGLGSDLASRWAEILTEHLATTPRATGEDSWAYKQRLVEVFDFPSFWASCPGVIRVYINRKPSLTSLEEVKKIPSLTTMTSPSTLSLLPPLSQETSPKIAIIPESLADTPVLTEGDLDRLSSAHRSDIFRNRSATNVRWCVGPLLAVDWRTPPEAETLYTPFPERPVAITPLPDPTVIGATIHKTTSNTYGHCLLNADHPFVKWLVLARGACERGQHRLSPEQFSRVMSLLADPLSYHGFHVESLIKYLDGWRSLAELPPELYPPDTELTAAMFTLSPPRPPGT